MLPEQKIVKLALVTSELMRRLQLRQQEKTAGVSRINELVPRAVKSLVDNGRIYANQSEKVAEAIHDHGRTLELLASVAKHRLGDEATIGKPTKTAAEQSQLSRQPGQPVSDFGSTPHGRKFEERILGGAR